MKTAGSQHVDPEAVERKATAAKIKFEFPAREDMPAVDFFWYDGNPKDKSIKPFRPEADITKDIANLLENVPDAGCLLIGDNLESDIAGAKRVGMRTILTLTGVSRQSDVDAAPPHKRPDLIIADLTALL